MLILVLVQVFSLQFPKKKRDTDTRIGKTAASPLSQTQNKDRLFKKRASRKVTIEGTQLQGNAYDTVNGMNVMMVFASSPL